MSVCLINLLLLGLINALIIKAIAMHWHNSIFFDQSIPQSQHARSKAFFLAIKSILNGEPSCQVISATLDQMHAP